MTELALLNTAYPDNNPWFDLREYLVNGWRSAGSQTCGVSALPNLLFWSMRLVGDDATSNQFMAGIPLALLPPQNLPLPIYMPVGAAYCYVNRTSRLISYSSNTMAWLPLWDRKGELIVTGMTPRGLPF